MKILNIIYITIMILFLMNSAICFAKEDNEIETVGISEVIDSIKKELVAAQSVVIGEPKLELDTIELEFSALVENVKDGSISIQIPIVSMAGSVKAKGRYKNSNFQKINISLYPPKRQVLQGGSDSNFSELGLANTIIGIRKELSKGLNSEPKLLPKTVDIEVRFGVEKVKGGGGKIKLVVFEIGGEISLTLTNTQKIVIHFVKPKI